MGYSDLCRTAVGLCAVMLFAGPARAGTVLTLSDHSSDVTPPELLRASLVFTVLDDTLSLSVVNETVAPDTFEIDLVFFNVSSAVAGLEMVTAVSGWSLVEDATADGFGRFHFALTSSPGRESNHVAPGESVDFTFAISGDGPFAESDFTTVFSVVPPGSIPALAAARFVRGPGDASAFGAVVPEPATIVLAAVGAGWLVGSMQARRRRLRRQVTDRPSRGRA